MPNFASLIGTSAITAATLAFGAVALNCIPTQSTAAPAATATNVPDRTLADLQARLDAQEDARQELAAQLQAAQIIRALAASAKPAAPAPVKKVVVLAAAPEVAAADTVTGASGSYSGGSDAVTGGSGSTGGSTGGEHSDDHADGEHSSHE